MSELYIGLLSGTSADGIDAALVDFSGKMPKLISNLTKPLTNELQQTLISFAEPGLNEIDRLGELDILLGQAFAQAANALLKQAKVSAKEIKAIGSHGQNIRHRPNARYPFTLQIGDPNTIASLTGITTIADFRRKDLSLGGQGAPLAPAFHQALFQTDKTNRIVLNIGGIANITVLEKETTKPVIGFDTGPGNCLMNAWCQKQINKAFDKNGNWAASGAVLNDLLETLLSFAYFQTPNPKSTGRETFNLTWLEAYLKGDENPADVQATLLALTTHSIANAINVFFDAGEILVCGGGVHNDFLMQTLFERCSNFTITSTATYDVDPDTVEAMLFAWLAMRTLNKQTGNLPEVTGAKANAVLGGIWL